MKKKGKTKQQILFEEKTEPVLNDYSVQDQDKIELKKLKEAIRKIADAAEQRIKKLNAELNFVKEELRQAIEKQKHAVEILRQQEPLLSERVKEISCLYSVISLLGNKKYVSDDEKIHDIVKLIPTGWQYPEDTCVQIILEGKEYKTDNFKEMPWRQTAEILVNGAPKGILAVSYLREKPAKDEGPFYMEERTLIDVIAKFIGEMIEIKLAEKTKIM
ncbi:MAG: hypothetical protein A2026_16315 [Deltaproteobacteria bacterium RBG_19FT_COMBO_46_12]|jgi:hypothetical protein|nr:MAG: hypothetical protein A2026_16315 [Deltaproteobacteria bacterium RBG_19FT_COMBO_46_12]